MDSMTDAILAQNAELRVRAEQTQAGLNAFAKGVGEAIGFEVGEGTPVVAILDALKARLAEPKHAAEPTPMLKAKA